MSIVVRSWRAISCAILLVTQSCHPASAQQLSSAPITLVVPFTPGTGPDFLARLIGGELQKRWSQPVVVENKAGASGNIGTHSVSRAAADGHTILVTTNQLTGAVSFFKSSGYDPIKSFVPIVKLGVGAIALCVAPSMPVDTIQQFVNFIRSKHGDVDYGSSGNGGPHHLAMERLKQIAGFDIKHVPYRGTAGAAQDLLGGHVAAGFLSLTVAQPLAESKSLKIIGIASKDRLPTSPNIPTIAEQGISGFEVDLWFGMLAPAGTPKEVIEKYNLAVNQIILNPEIKAAAAKQGILLTGGSAADFKLFLETDLSLWKKVVDEAGIAPN